jgi:hypothetical protein
VLAAHLASSYRLQLAVAFAVGFGVATIVMTLFPGAGKGHDPGLLLLLTFALPMAATAGLMVWARAWRKRHAAKRR